MRILGAACAFVVLLLMAAARARACDLCGCYTPQMETTLQAGPFDQTDLASARTGATRFYAAVFEQFTHDRIPASVALRF